MTTHALSQPATHAHLLPFYKRIQQVGLRLNQKLVKTLSRETLDEGGRRLGMLRNGSIVLETEDEIAVLMDYCIYNCYSGGLNAVQRYLAESPPRADSEEMLLLRAYQNAYYSLFRVTGAEQGVGVTVRDAMRENTAFLMDVGMGSTARVGDAFAGRMIPMEDFLKTGGASLPLTRTAVHELFKNFAARPRNRFHLSDTRAGSPFRRNDDPLVP